MKPLTLDQILQSAAAESSGRLRKWLARLREGEQARKKAAAPEGNSGPACLTFNPILASRHRQGMRKAVPQ